MTAVGGGEWESVELSEDRLLHCPMGARDDRTHDCLHVRVSHRDGQGTSWDTVLRA